MSEEVEPEDSEDVEKLWPEWPEDSEDVEVEDIPEEYRLSLNGRHLEISLGQGRYVRIESGGVKGYLEPHFVRAVQKAPQDMGRVYIKPVEPKRVLRSAYDVIGVVRFLGTTGFTAISTHENGRRVLEHRQYIRPIAQHAPALYSLAVALKELYASGTPFSAVVLAYIKDKIRVLPIKSITAYFKRYNSSAGVRAYPEVRLLPAKPVIGGAKKRTAYVCDLLTFHPLARAVRQTAGVEESGAGVRGRRSYRALPLGTYVAPPPEIHIVTGQAQEGQAQEAEASAGQYIQPVEVDQTLNKYIQPVEVDQTITVYPRSLSGIWVPLEGSKYVQVQGKYVKLAD